MRPAQSGRGERARVLECWDKPRFSDCYVPLNLTPLQGDSLLWNALPGVKTPELRPLAPSGRKALNTHLLRVKSGLAAKTAYRIRDGMPQPYAGRAWGGVTGVECFSLHFAFPIFKNSAFKRPLNLCLVNLGRKRAMFSRQNVYVLKPPDIVVLRNEIESS